jgi:hypothetical protein
MAVDCELQFQWILGASFTNLPPVFQIPLHLTALVLSKTQDKERVHLQNNDRKCKEASPRIGQDTIR